MASEIAAFQRFTSLPLAPDRPAADLVAFFPMNVNADSFVAGSQEDPAAVAVGDAARDLARWPDRPGPSPVV